MLAGLESWLVNSLHSSDISTDYFQKLQEHLVVHSQWTPVAIFKAGIPMYDNGSCIRLMWAPNSVAILGKHLEHLQSGNRITHDLSILLLGHMPWRTENYLLTKCSHRCSKQWRQCITCPRSNFTHKPLHFLNAFRYLRIGKEYINGDKCLL